ncbi:hypothetical protein DN826_20975 [Stutzerimonas nosocomialis]|uniref:hypothetical protein n=1 Tax=Stutzerimonas nosocomialis TaxID=1056496 RepID=UPI001107F3B5|nr:hypothetical protein [Stutzerimonas nosocomialis]TLX52949.1 hypothetical protein DN826_20975 [Stutzerimonas nosocomialis]
MSNPSMTLDDAMKLASEAFLPLGCVTNANPEDDSFGFTVMNSSGEPVLQVANVPSSQYADPISLGGVLQQARLDVEHKGCHLEPWTMPMEDATGIPVTPPNY